MSMIRLTNVIHSLNEQKKVIKKMFALFPNATFNPCSNSFNFRYYSGFEANVPFEKFIPIAHRYTITRDDLFEYGRPKVINPHWRIWEEFLSIKLYWYGKYNYYYSESWHNYKRRSIEASITLQSHSYRQGLKHWKSRFKKTRNLLNANPNKELVKAYKDEIDKINQEILDWEEAIKKAGEINLNGQTKGGN